MSHIEFGTKERALLLGLMTLGGTATNPQLREQVRNALDGASRRRMNELGLVDSAMVNRSYQHTLTEPGWSWCQEELSAPAPERAGSLGYTLYGGILPMIRDFLDYADVSLADFARAQGLDLADAAGAVVVAANDAPDDGVATDAGNPGMAPVDPAALHRRIRAAYWSLAEGPQDWVLLTAVRPLLADTPRAAVDAALQEMERLPDVHIAPEANQKTLTAADRAAAVRIGGRNKHLLAIEAR